MAKEKTKAMTLRLPVETAQDLEAVAQVEGVPISNVVRVAIQDYVKRRRAQKDFRARLKVAIEENRELLERLGH